MKKFLLLLLVVFSFAMIASAQPRPAEKANTIDPNTPDSFEVRYEGGVFGMSGKEKGTLKFDDANERVVFYRVDKKEMFGISYEAMLTLYPDSKESVPQAGKVISALPLPGAGLANLMSKDTKYAIISFEDTEIGQRPTVSFRFENKKELLGFINKLGVKSKMTQRGDAYYRPKKAVF
ncbi:MAG: hypothetical protein ABL952_17040 [Pyrinomonadaceae bacterium]